MLYTRKITNLFLLLLLLSAAITSCMDEESLYGKDGEPPVTPVEPEEPAPGHKENVSLQFRLEVNAGVGSEDHLLDEMDGFTIFLFDADGGYLRQEVVTRAQLQANDNTVTLDMDPGKYQMVCWGNSAKYSMITNLKAGVHIAEAAIVHTASKGGKVVVVPDGDPLYFAPRNTVESGKLKVESYDADTRVEDTRVASSNTAQPTVNSQLSTVNSGAASRSAASGGSYAFTVPEQGVVYADIAFTQAHKKLKVYVKNFKGTDAGGSTDCPEVHVGALVCGYNFLLQPVEGAQLAYRNRTTQQADTRSGTTCAQSGFNAPLFTLDDQLTIDVINPADQKVHLTLDLIDELKKQNINPADDAIGEIRVDIEFDETFDATVTINIPRWNETPVVPDLN